MKILLLALSYERGGYSSIRFIYKNNPKRSSKKYEYQKAEISEMMINILG